MWITKTSIDNPVFATMVMVAITVLGIFSYQRLSIEQMPDTALPYVFVQTQYPGASPEVVENDVTKPIELAVNQVSGVKRIYSTSREGRSDVFVEFRLSTDVTPAVQDVRAIGFGKPARGKTFPAIYLVGRIHNVEGLFRSTDTGASWVRINDDQHQYGLITHVTGDPRIFGRVYLGTSGRGIIYGDPAEPR